jgi:SAM-dependent methyltransferase
VAEHRYTPEAISADLRVSQETDERIGQWWDRAHDTDHQQWLTGSPGAEVWERLDVAGLLQPGVDVLNIGVGLGRCTRELAALGCAVSALDISPVAVERVKDVATGYLASDLGSLPANRFDLALSHLVAQHMRDADLLDQIHHVVRSLKPDGLFAMQYADHKFGVLPDQPQTLDMAKGGSICRQEDQMAALVDQAGGKVVRSILRESHDCGIIWRVAHVRRS